MFTTLTTTIKSRQNLREKLHLTRTRKFESMPLSADGITFYTTHLLTYSSHNEPHLMGFIKNCPLPVIKNDDVLVLKYRYIVTLNTLIYALQSTLQSCAVVDPKGHLIFLLPHLLSRCRSVTVYTFESEKYAAENEQLYATLGAGAVITTNFGSLNKFDAVFSEIPLPFCDNKRLFGRFSYLSASPPILPDNIKELPLSPDEIYPVLAGLYYVCDFKKLGLLRADGL